MKKWEYSMFRVNEALRSSAHFINSQGEKTKLKRASDEETILYINRLGEVGWELIDGVSILDSRMGATNTRWIFKRPKEE